MKLNHIEKWNLMPPRGHWRSLGWKWNDWVLGSAAYEKGQLKALLSAHIEGDENPWLHLSVSHIERIPTYEELQGAWRAFLGNRPAYQAFVPVEEHVNIHPRTLHLWAPVSHRPLPDFRHEDGTI